MDEDYVLIDYDNLSSQHKSCGLRDLLQEIVNKTIVLNGRCPDRIKCRVYGGWYENSTPTVSAQILSSKISSDFPTTLIQQDRMGRTIKKIIATAELAYSLMAEPKKHLVKTLRKRPFGANVEINNLTLTACSQANCLGKVVESFFKNKLCPHTSCNYKQVDLLLKREQKLVDTMMTSDLIFLAIRDKGTLSLVSSDDDVWPGIQTALNLGASVNQVHTSKRATPIEYTGGVSQKFKEVHL